MLKTATTFFLLLLALNARACCSGLTNSPSFFNSVGTSDLVAYGVISKVKEGTYVLTIHEVLVGSYPQKEVEIRKHRRLCAFDGDSYRTGQELIVFVRFQDEKDPRYSVSQFVLRGGGGGRSEISVSNGFAHFYVHSRYGAPGGDGKPQTVKQVELKTMSSAIKGYKKLYELNFDKQSNKVQGIKIKGSYIDIKWYKNQSVVHQFLIESTHAAKMKLLKQKLKNRKRYFVLPPLKQ